MPIVPVNGIDLWFDTTGDSSGDPLVLLPGYAAQAPVVWENGFCELLAAGGFYVVRYDNRDSGLSTHFYDVRLPIRESLRKLFRGERVDVPYRVADMAADVAGLLDHLGIGAAHMVGMSMGGLIAQTLAIEYPDRVRTLTSIMSSTGDRDVGQPTADGLQALLGRPPEDREAAIEHMVSAARVIASPDHWEEAHMRQVLTMGYDRSFDPFGAGRQLLAVFSSDSTTERLRHIKAPSLVIHGTADKVIDISGGRRTAESILGAELLIIDGLGHDIPRGLWPALVGAITRHVEQATAPTR